MVRKSKKRKQSKPSTKETTTASKYAIPAIHCRQLHVWCQANNIELKSGLYARVGDVVICSDGGKNFDKPDDLGTVISICPAGATQSLEKIDGKAHPDGAWAHIYVLTYKKQRKNSKKTLTCSLNLIGLLLRNYCTAPVIL